MSHSWQPDALRELNSRRGTSSAWSYRQGLAPAVEPTALCCFALAAQQVPLNSASVETRTAQSTPDPSTARTGKAACEWMRMIQQPDGSVPVTERLLKPGWTTAYSLLQWIQFPDFETQIARACEWLLETQGHTFARTEENAGIIGHDPTLIGWPWVIGTHSWIEPTALAILALRAHGLAAHPRSRQGVDMIIDRSIHSGGWNYGNKSVYGMQLRPQPGPTGLALLALTQQDRSPRVVSLAIDYLRQTLPAVQAPVSLSWGILGLRAHHACPPAADAWLASVYHRTIKRPDAAMSLALMLLASDDRGLSPFFPPERKSPAARALPVHPTHASLEHSS